MATFITDRWRAGSSRSTGRQHFPRVHRLGSYVRDYILIRITAAAHSLTRPPPPHRMRSAELPRTHTSAAQLVRSFCNRRLTITFSKKSKNMLLPLLLRLKTFLFGIN